MKEQVRLLIEKFEKGAISPEKAAQDIQKLTKNEVDVSLLKNYWRAESLGELVSRLCMPVIDDWQELSDKEALQLIQEIIDNITDDAIFERNSEALEKRYGKSSGSVSDMVFHQDLGADEILEQLSRDTRTVL